MLSAMYLSRFFLGFIILIMATSTGFAMVVGQDGNIYEIEEKDFLKIIQERAASIDWEEKKQKWQAKTKEDVENYRPKNSVSNIPPAQTEEVYKVDLSYTLSFDITDIYGNVIFPQGYTFNPLEEMKKQGIYYTKKIIAINGLREREVDWFKKNFNNDPNSMLVITDGYALDLNKKLNRPVYYLTQKMKEKFVIEFTPSLVFQKKDSVYMTVKTFCLEDVDEKENIK